MPRSKAGHCFARFTSVNGKPRIARHERERNLLRRVFCQFRHLLAMPLRGSNHFHLLPVVGELLTAVQTDDVGSRQSRGLGTSFRAAYRNRKAEMCVPAAEKYIENFLNHDPPSIPERMSNPGIY